MVLLLFFARARRLGWLVERRGRSEGSWSAGLGMLLLAGCNQPSPSQPLLDPLDDDTAPIMGEQPSDEAPPLLVPPVVASEPPHVPPAARPEAELDFVAQLSHPLGPALAQPGKAFLRSSRQPEAQVGMRNFDFSNFLGDSDGAGILAQEDGPGVITRMWFTVGPPGFASGDDFRLRMFIDGRELPLSKDPRGITLTQLTSGTISGLPHPWVLGPDTASGGYLLNVPIQYRESLRIELSNTSPLGPFAQTFYQIEGRSLPSPPPASFSLPPPARHDASLGQALALWRDHVAHPGVDQRSEAPGLDAGEGLLFETDGEGVITSLLVEAEREVRDLLEVAIEVDGVEAARTSLGWLTGSVAPAGDYVSSLTAASEQSAALYYPIPFHEHVRIRLLTDSPIDRPLALTARVHTRQLPANTGRFRATCGSSSVSLPMPKLDDWQSPLEFPNVVVGAPLVGPGWYSGQSFYLHAPLSWGWALEPDHEIFVDGEYPILGTGSEDYFGGAYYFMHGPFVSLLSGATGWLRGDRDDQPSDTHLYRHHMVGGIPFEREFRFEYESYVNDARYDGCLFWYATPPDSAP
jgi:hypothetical protein